MQFYQLSVLCVQVSRPQYMFICQTIHYFPEIADWSSISNQINISDISQSLRINTCEIGISIIMEYSYTSLAYIVVTGPCKVSNYVWISFNKLPEIFYVSRICFRTENRFSRM